MALTDFYSNFHLFIRWLHVIAGIAWIGILYFFNFINIHLQKTLEESGKKAVNPKLMPRALWWFRWGAMITFVAGLVLFFLNYMYEPGIGVGASANWSDIDGLTSRASWIIMGMLFGTAMWFNVWFVIWPAQKKILKGQGSKEKLAILRSRAGKFSKMNTYMSGPMLFGMLAPNHYGSANFVTLIVAIVLGVFAIWVAYRHAGKVGQSV
ncbi:hypothetical protein BVX98_01955 [bacterium F11]|nr:hypothetical protein BVX98_01955 [bacterium F11]